MRAHITPRSPRLGMLPEVRESCERYIDGFGQILSTRSEVTQQSRCAVGVLIAQAARHVQRSLAPLVRHIHFRATICEQLDHFIELAGRGTMHRCVASLINSVDIGT